MRIDVVGKKVGFLCSIVIVTVSLFTANPSYADTINEDGMISNIVVPETGVIQYDVTVPAESTVNYSVELTPDKKTGTIDKVSGMWKNTTKKTVKRTITANVKFLSSEYTISASYESNSTKQKFEYKDQCKAVKSYEASDFHSRLAWDTGSTSSLKDTAIKYLNRISELVNK